MNGSKVCATVGAALACFALHAMAQGTTTTTTTDPKNAPKTEEAKKAVAKKAEPKKAEPKKAEPKRAPPKKVDGKAQATPQGGTIQKYEVGKAPVLKDSKGNTIPTSPDAYDVSSATNPPPKKK